jgi:Fe-S-cluster containining protein
MSDEVNYERLKNALTVVDSLVDDAITQVAERGDTIRCAAGCAHCCHLLVETNWEEACNLVEWLENQTEEVRNSVISRIQAAAAERKSFFRARKKSRKFAHSVEGEIELSAKTYDRYFYEKARPCPFLLNDSCQAYEHRPSACRLHLVTSDPDICGRDVEDESDYCVPDEVDRAKELAEDVLLEGLEDGRWGELSIIVEEALYEKGIILG